MESSEHMHSKSDIISHQKHDIVDIWKRKKVIWISEMFILTRKKWTMDIYSIYPVQLLNVKMTTYTF